MKSKSGVSAVVATVLIVMITVAAVAVVWAVIIPMIKENAGSINDKTVQLEIVTSKGYTVYDSGKGFIQLQIKRGQDDLNLSGYQVVFYSGGNAHSVEVNESEFPELIPAPAQTIVVGFELPENFGKPERIRIAPIVDGELKSVVSEISVALGSGLQDAVNGIECVDVDIDDNGGVMSCILFASGIIDSTYANSNPGLRVSFQSADLTSYADVPADFVGMYVRFRDIGPCVKGENVCVKITGAWLGTPWRLEVSRAEHLLYESSNPFSPKIMCGGVGEFFIYDGDYSDCQNAVLPN